MTEPLLQEIAWLGLECRVPRDWEIVRHSVAPARGSLIFVDRRRQRLELGWLAVKAEPDLDRWARDLESEERRRRADLDLREVRFANGWRALEWSAENGDDVTTRAVRYEASIARLIEVVVETRRSAAADRDLARRLLDRVAVAGAPETARRVRAFGVAVAAPEPLRFSGAEVRPADVRFDFSAYDRDADRELRTVASVRRLGMARSWYNGDAAALIRNREAHSRFSKFEPASAFGHEALLAEGHEAGPLAKRALGLLRESRVLFWQCPENNALFAVSTRSPRGKPLDPAAFGVRCCGDSA